MHLKNIFKVKYFLVYSLLIGSYSCNFYENKPNNTNNIKYDNKLLEKKNLGLVKLNVEGNIFKKGFRIKASDLTDPLTKKLRVEIRGLGLDTPITQTIKWTPGTPVSFNVPVVAGKNRVVILSALDGGDRVLGTYMGALDVIAGTNNKASISYFDTVIAQTLIGILNNEKELLTKVDLAKLREYFIQLTGYNETKNSFNKIDPAKLNTSLITDEIISKEGELPGEDIEQFGKLENTGSIELGLDVIGSNIIINDLNSKPFVITSNKTKIDGITLGEWDLTIIKEGFVSQTYKINVSDLGFELNIDLPTDNRSRTNLTKEELIVKLKEPYSDPDLGITISDFKYSVNTDKDGNGGEDEDGEGWVEVDGFGKHKIISHNEDYDVMSNELDISEMYDETSDQTVTFIADQDLQFFGVLSDNEEFFIETNFDKTWTFNDQIAKTPQELAVLVLNHPVFKDISIHSIASMLIGFKTKSSLPSIIESKATLTPVSCDSGSNRMGSSNYDSYEQLTEIVNQAFLYMKTHNKKS